MEDRGWVRSRVRRGEGWGSSCCGGAGEVKWSVEHGV